MPRSRARATEWNTLSQAAVGRMLGISTERVGQLIEAGRLPSHRVEGWMRPRVLMKDAEAFLRSRGQRSR